MPLKIDEIHAELLKIEATGASDAGTVQRQYQLEADYVAALQRGEVLTPAIPKDETAVQRAARLKTAFDAAREAHHQAETKLDEQWDELRQAEEAAREEEAQNEARADAETEPPATESAPAVPVIHLLKQVPEGLKPWCMAEGDGLAITHSFEHATCPECLKARLRDMGLQAGEGVL